MSGSPLRRFNGVIITKMIICLIISNFCVSRNVVHVNTRYPIWQAIDIPQIYIAERVCPRNSVNNYPIFFTRKTPDRD